MTSKDKFPLMLIFIEQQLRELHKADSAQIDAVPFCRVVEAIDTIKGIKYYCKGNTVFLRGLIGYIRKRKADDITEGRILEVLVSDIMHYKEHFGTSLFLPRSARYAEFCAL